MLPSDVDAAADLPFSEGDMVQRPPSDEEQVWLSDLWQHYRRNLEKFFQVRMQLALRKRMDVEDLLQETFLSCGKRIDFLVEHADVPIYAKLRRIAQQCLTDAERRHLAAGKRDAMKERDLGDGSQEGAQDAWERFADSMTSPRTRLVKLERQKIVRRVLAELGERDREILELRHFEDLGNAECAAVLGIEAKAASIRYVRALKRFQELMNQFSLY